MSAQTFYTSTFNIKLLILIVIHLLVTDTESSNQYSSSKAVWVQVQGARHPIDIEVSSGASVSKIMQNTYLSIPASLKWMSEVDAKSMDGRVMIPVSMSVEDVLDSDIGTSAECALLLIEPEGMQCLLFFRHT